MIFRTPMRRFPLVLIAIALAALSASAQSTPVTQTEAHRRAEALLKQMTVDEKAGQMNQSSGVVMPMLGSAKPDDLIVQGRVGSILWLIDVKEINRLQHLAVEKSRLHIPILFGYDVTATGRSFRSRSPWLRRGTRLWRRPHSI